MKLADDRTRERRDEADDGLKLAMSTQVATMIGHGTVEDQVRAICLSSRREEEENVRKNLIPIQFGIFSNFFCQIQISEKIAPILFTGKDLLVNIWSTGALRFLFETD